MAITNSQDITWAIIGPSAITGDLDIEWAITELTTPADALTGSLQLQWTIEGVDFVTLVLNGAPQSLPPGVMTIEITRIDGFTVFGPTGAVVTEQPAGTGRYTAVVPVFEPGQYFAIWSDGGSTQTIAELDIEVVGVTEVTFYRFRPPARGDGLPWTEAVILEGASPIGPWVEIDTIELDPVDTDPTNPRRRTLTSTAPSGTSGWYAIQWTDSFGSTTLSIPQYSSGGVIQ